MRRRILLLVAGMTTLVVLAFAIPLAVVIRTDVYSRALTDLRREATSISVFLFRNRQPTDSALRAYLADLESGQRASVELASGRVVGSAPPGDPRTLPAAAAPQTGSPGGAQPGGRPPDPADVAWSDGRLVQLLVPDFDRSGQYVVRVWASDTYLRRGENGPWLLLAGASLGLLLLGVVLGELLTRRIVRPLVHAAETAQQLAAGDVTARATTSGPREVVAVGQGLNRLADRIDELIAEERETVADLSHRLRTPLTALRLDAEALRDPVEAERVGSHVSALERMLTAVIHAARRPQREGRMPSCDATAVVGERVAFWSALAEDQGRKSTLELPGASLLVRAGAEDLAAAVDALLENVVAHTPEGTPFAVRLTGTGAGARLQVSDDGPGLPDDASVRGRSDRGSSGLGLDIARRCAEAAGGSMELGSGPSGGARITLLLASP